MTTPETDFEKTRELGWRIYNEKIKPLVEPQEKGKFLVIDVASGITPLTVMSLLRGTS